ncbi:Uncharacterised protein [Vibrio cholerae]|nr:Uncharacterised protein [Vibrio cholerae]
MEIFRAHQKAAHLGSAQRQTPNYKRQLDAHAHLRNSKTGLAQTQAECVAAILQPHNDDEAANAG